MKIIITNTELEMLEVNNFEGLFDKLQDNAVPKVGEFIQDGLKYCATCNEPLQCKVELLGREYLMPIPCLCRRQEIEIANQQYQQIQKQQTIERLKCGITDSKYKDMIFENSSCNELIFAKRYVENFQKYSKENTGLMILGDTGTGKTYVAGCIANALVLQGVSVFMANILYITDKMMNLFSDERQGFIESLQRYDLLIIDDFGAERFTEFACEQVYHLIETRYRCKKPLIITSNLTLEQFKSNDVRVKRTYDRVKEMCHPITMTGESIRRSIANDRYRRVKNELEG